LIILGKLLLIFKSMISIPQRLLGEALLISSIKNPFKTAIIAGGKEFSFSTLKENSLKLAQYLINAGIEKGDRVAIYMNNSWQSVVSIYGTTLAGAVFLIINPQTKANKLQYILNDSGAKILISQSSLREEILQALKDTKSIHGVILEGEEDQMNKGPQDEFLSFDDVLSKSYISVNLPKIIPNDLAALIYTSGSTGFPKGVMMTHQSMVFTSWSLIEYLRLTEGDRILVALPLAFDYGLYQLLVAVTIGGTLIVENSFNFPPTIFRQIEKLKPTVFPGVPTIYAIMITTHKKTGLTFECVEKITNTAARLPAEFIPDLKKIFPNALIFKMYGLTECKRVCYLEPELIDLKPTSVGKAIPGTEVFLLSPDEKPVPYGEPGILHVRGPHVMVGYWNNEELTKDMLKPGAIPGEKILCAHDWFKMDEEGFLYFQGRNDDIIKTRGEKVSPVEIENVIYKNIGIKEVAVLGIPDGILGESIVAFVTSHYNAQITEKDIQQECMDHLEIFMIPKKIVFLPEMPKSSNGKIDKKELKRMFFEIEIDEIYHKLRNILENRLNFQDDKPEETIDSSLKALWFKASGIPKSAEHAIELPLPELSEQQVDLLKKLVEKRLNGVPLAYITGRQSFMSIELLTDNRALIPRKETEILGRKALEVCQKLSEIKQCVNILDICCGSGNLGLALAHFLPNVFVFASDLSSEAVELTGENISFLNLNKRVNVRQSDLFSAFETDDYYGKTDLIVCNPPYISSSKVAKMNSEILENEPAMAFDGGMMGFRIIQKLIQEAPKFLSSDGWVIFEVGVGQGPFIIQLCEKSQLYKQIGSFPENNIRVVFASCMILK